MQEVQTNGSQPLTLNYVIITSNDQIFIPKDKDSLIHMILKLRDQHHTWGLSVNGKKYINKTCCVIDRGGRNVTEQENDTPRLTGSKESECLWCCMDN